MRDEHVTRLIQEVFRKAESDRDMEVVEAASQALGEYARRMDAALQGREYLAGDFGLADISAFMVFGFASALQAAPAPELGALHGWLARTGSRPSVAAEWEAMMKEAARA